MPVCSELQTSVGVCEKYPAKVLLLLLLLVIRLDTVVSLQNATVNPSTNGNISQVK